jgi:hypothetical protein
VTTIEMQSRVMAQLRSFPGQARTAGDIAAGMVGREGKGTLAAADIEPTLRLLEKARPQQLAVREPQRKGPDKWRLA